MQAVRRPASPSDSKNGLHLGREVGQVHVVDDVVDRAEEAEGAGRLERGAVLDVAALDPVVPVHPAIQCRSAVDAGGDLRGADRGHRRERGDAVGDELPALEQRAEAGASPFGDGPLELVGSQ